MERKKKDVYHVGPLTEGKRNIISALMDEYEIKTAEDIQDALKDLLGGTIRSMMESEMTNHLGYPKSARSHSENCRNGSKTKTVRSKYGEFEVDVPKDRNGTFEPQIVKNRQKDISRIDDKIISMYAKGLTTRQISEQIEDIYGFACSKSFISDVTDKILKDIDEWQHRPLNSVYPIVFIEPCHFFVRDNGMVRKLAAYVMFGINSESLKKIISLSIGENESAKYWLGVLNELKNRGVKDMMILCADGWRGIQEAVTTAFPKTEYQRCIVHMVRNTLKHVYYKDMKPFATDLKTIYYAESEKAGRTALDKVSEKWGQKYPYAMKHWYDNWDALCPIFKFSMETRKIIYTTNAIESVNSTYKKLNRQRSVFPSSTALLKALYLSTLQITKKWRQALKNWGGIYGEFSVIYEGRMPE